jgi:hypothetical protein
MALYFKKSKRSFRDVNFIVSFVCLMYIVSLSIYYGLQEQVDFRVFWTAGKEWNEGSNPYLKENQGNPSHPLLNAPPSLLLYGILGKIDLQVAAVTYRLFCVVMLLVLALFISRTIQMSFNLVFPFLALSTPFRTNLGSGQVSLLASIAFIYIVLSLYKNQKINNSAIVFSLFVILTFKAYMFPATIVLLILKKRMSLVIFGILTFVISLLVLEVRIKMLESWVRNTSRIGAVAVNEANNSSIISIMSRITNNLSIGIIVYLIINIVLMYFVIKFRKEVLILPTILILGLVSSIYVHHQDYLLALVALIIWLTYVSRKNSKIFDFFQIGLQPNSLLLHLTTFLLRVLQFNGKKPKNYSWYPLLISSTAAFFWYQGNIDASFLIYDSIYMVISLLIMYRIRKSIIHS